MSIMLTPFSAADYNIVDQEVKYQGFYSLVHYSLQHKKFDGTWTNVFQREVVKRPMAAAVLPYDPVLDKVILLQQFRAGALAAKDSPWLIEMVAGLLTDKTETPTAVVEREAEEEAGCKLLALHPLYEYFVSPGGSDEYISVFIGQVDASNAGGIFGLAEENEDIRAFTLSLDEAFSWLQTKKIQNAPTIISLQWLQLNREWLKNLWQKK
jgi:ADP-ribose pyrophosphatase